MMDVIAYNYKRVSTRINDVYKAYDHVLTDKLKVDLSEINQLDMIDLVNDYDKCNLSVGSSLIKRSRGLPQGAKGAPMMFNLYLNKALNDTLKSDFIYADNIILSDKNKEHLNERENNIIMKCKERNLIFKDPWDELNFSSTNYEALPYDGPICTKLSNIPPNDHPDVRILGYHLQVKNDILIQNLSRLITGITFKLPLLPPYKAITYYRQFIKPKFQFHYRLRELPKNIIRTIIRKMTCIRNVPDYYLDENHIFKPGKSDYWTKFWSLYCYKKNGNISLPEDIDIDKYRRFRILTTLIPHYYMSIYQITKFVFTGRANLTISPITDIMIKNNVKMLDLIWFILIRKYNISKARIVMEFTILNRCKMKRYIAKQLPNLNLI